MTSDIEKHALVAIVAIMDASSIMSAAKCKRPRTARVGLKGDAMEQEEPNHEWPGLNAKRALMIQPELKLPTETAFAGNLHEWAVTKYAHLFEGGCSDVICSTTR